MWGDFPDKNRSPRRTRPILVKFTAVAPAYGTVLELEYLLHG